MDSRSEPGTPASRALGILPLRNAVLFPMSVVPINVGRPRSIRLVDDASKLERGLIGVLSQHNSDTDDPEFGDLYQVGTVARIVKVIRLAQANYSVVLNGLGRFRVKRALTTEPYLRAEIERLPEPQALSLELEQASQKLRDVTRKVLELMPDLPKETAGILENVRDPGALADLIASNLPDEYTKHEDRQRILETLAPGARLDLVTQIVERHLERLTVKDRIEGQVRGEMSRSQREYVLREQMRAILNELGEGGDGDEIEELRNRLGRTELPEEVHDAARRQLNRLNGMQPQSAEYNVARTYVEWLLDIPWRHQSPDQLNVARVRQCLDEDHYGLEQVKERIVGYAAIRQLRKDKRGPILLFAGPPGVGKTSLGRSIARSMGRRYARIALGGVRDEAEIRGHRRTYVGALPGRLVQALKRAGTNNPVLILDEVDKLGVDVRGDPAAALLEVLDPEQNHTFVDHYIDLPVDLSQVMFIATANQKSAISPPLRDRMELIDVPGYTRNEKIHIAEQFLVLKQLRDHGLTEEQLTFTRRGIEEIIDYYTREAGVRGLEREVASLCRHIAVELALGKAVSRREVVPDFVQTVLGQRRCHPESTEKTLPAGVAVGLSDSSSGGDILVIEATKMPGKGKIRVTGNLKGVMKESAATAMSFVRSRAERFRLDHEWLRDTDLHLHVPRAALARDAAAAGVTMCVAVASLLLRRSMRSDLAITGELTLRGRVLPVGGIKAKLLAAHRAGIKVVVLPEGNRRDLDELPKEVLSQLEIVLVKRVDEVLAYAFGLPEGTIESPATQPSI